MATVLASAPTIAQPWPSKPVRIVVPAPAGSSLDFVARLLGDKLKDKWGQPVIVDPKPGAGGTIGVDIAAKATDQHTLVIGFPGPTAYGPFLYKKMPYDVSKDLVPIVITTTQPNVLAVNANLPVRNVAELVVYSKANPGKLSYASVGNGSSSHLAMELTELTLVDGRQMPVTTQLVQYAGGPSKERDATAIGATTAPASPWTRPSTPAATARACPRAWAIPASRTAR